jgi:cytoskeletal protein RodZ
MVGFADETVVGGGESVGARLRQARESHGFSLDDISARTRVPARHLKAIEEDAFDQLPAAPYSVGFAKAFADAVGLNREEIGREFRAEKEGYGAADAGPSYVSEEPGPSINGGLVRIVLILAIIAAAAFGLWKSGIFGGSSQVAAPAVAPLALPQATPPANQSVAETSTTTSDDNASAASNENSSQTKSSSEAGDKGDKRHKSESNDENGTAATSDKGTTSTTGSNEARESEKPPVPTTRDLNLNAQKAASPVAPPAGMTPPVAAPPVIAPPPPPPSAPPAAPAATP